MAKVIRCLVVAGVLATACGTGGGTAEQPSDEEAEQPSDENAAPTTVGGVSASVTQGLDEVDLDTEWPEGSPELATGAVGFSRYVYADLGGEILPFLLEGPAGDQVRCQDVELPCSYLELKELSKSGDPIPDELGMTADELATLVDQLDTLSSVLTSFETIDDACAAGYRPYTSQWSNMGVHLRNAANAQDRVMDPAKPDVVMFARPGGETLPLTELGTCDGDEWTGPAGFEVVGSAFYLPIAAEHPDGWAGPIDNWHVHYNACGGSQISGVTPVTADECEADGGTFFTVDPQWMIHAYAVPAFDNQLGVFSMWNPTVSPLVPPEDIEASRNQLEVEGAVTWTISDFRFSDLDARVGQAIVFGNSDATPHTVTAVDSELFDSGPFGTGGAYAVSFDAPGDYAYFCSIHPSMTGTIHVR